MAASAKLMADESPVAVLEAESGVGVIQDKSTGVKAVILMPMYDDLSPLVFSGVILGMQNSDRMALRFAQPEVRTLIDTARNRLAHRFMKNFKAERAIFLDGDVLPPIGNVEWWRTVTRTTLPDRFGSVNFFTRMMQHPLEKGVVGAAYFDRVFGQELQCSRGVGSEKEPQFNDNFRSGKFRGLIPVSWVATGGMMIPRWVFEKLMSEAHRWPEVQPSAHGKHYGFFSRPRHSIGEDVAFCKRCAELNVPVHLDCDLRLHHRGDKWL